MLGDPKEKQCTFYSNRRLSWSRIDRIWTSTELVSKMQKIDIEASTWAERNPITTTWKGQRGKNEMDTKSKTTK